MSLVVLLVVVVAAAVSLRVLDREARRTATAVVAEQVQRELGLPAPPDVRIGGRSFLWQAVRGTYDDATISAPSATYQGTTVQRPVVRLRDTGVPVGVLLGRGGTIEVNDAVGSALLPWALLEERASAATEGAELSLSADGPAVRVETEVTVLRQDVPLAVTATPELTGTTLQLRPASLAVAGQEVEVATVRNLVDRPGLRRLLPLLDGVEVPLDDVPPGVTVSGVRVVADGVETDVVLSPTTFPVPG